MKRFAVLLSIVAVTSLISACGSDNLNGTENPVISEPNGSKGVTVQIKECSDYSAVVSVRNSNDLASGVLLFLYAGDEQYGFEETVQPGDSELRLNAENTMQYPRYPYPLAPKIVCGATNTLQ